MSTEMIDVYLLRMPLRIQREATEHHDALVREFELIRHSSGATETVPVRLLDLMDEIDRRYGQFTEQPRAVLEAALQQRADGCIDLQYHVPVEIAEAASDLLDLLDEADAYCRAGRHLITLAAPPHVRDYRRWALGEFVEQARGRPPRPWDEEMPNDTTAPGPAPTAERPPLDDRWPSTTEGDTATVVLSGELDLGMAPSLRDHLNALHALGVRHFVIDTADVSFIDSVGLSVLLAVYRRCRDDGGTITLVRTSPVVRRTLEVSGLLEVLDVA